MEYALLPPKQDLFARLASKYEQSAVEANLPTYNFEERIFIISRSMARSVGYEMKSVIPTIFHKLGSAKSKRISSLMKKLNRKRVYMSDNRVIVGANYWTFTSSRTLE